MAFSSINHKHSPFSTSRTIILDVQSALNSVTSHGLHLHNRGVALAIVLQVTVFSPPLDCGHHPSTWLHCLYVFNIPFRPSYANYILGLIPVFQLAVGSPPPHPTPHTAHEMDTSAVTLDYDTFCRAFLSPPHINFRPQRTSSGPFAPLSRANELPEDSLSQYFVGRLL